MDDQSSPMTPPKSCQACWDWYPCVPIGGNALVAAQPSCRKVLPCPPPQVQCTERGLRPPSSQGLRERGDLGLSLVFILFWSRLKNWALRHLEGSCGGSLCAEAAQRLCTPDVYPGGQGKLQGEEALQGPLLGCKVRSGDHSLCLIFFSKDGCCCVRALIVHDGTIQFS